jgi:PleD family two-component response regulator
MAAQLESKVESPSLETACHVLIADDHASARRALREVLIKKGFAVTAVADGKAALRVLSSENAPCIALLDWDMPGMTGVEVCKEVRSTMQAVPIFLIVTSARDEADCVGEALAAGANDFIRKPFEIVELVARVRNGEGTLKYVRGLLARIIHLERALELPETRLAPPRRLSKTKKS